jgi:hypothetical protein
MIDRGAEPFAPGVALEEDPGAVFVGIGGGVDGSRDADGAGAFAGEDDGTEG